MGCTKRHIYGLAGLDRPLLSVKRHTGAALHDHPVLAALRMLLVAQPFPREHFETFYFVVMPLIKDGIAPPWALLKRG